jgi:hypothetical protein
MEETYCPIDCISRDLICDSPPDFLDKHSSFIITVIGVVSGSIGVVLTYFLKSRCTEIKCWGFFCRRKPLETDIETINVESVSATN